jgi:hypothetical protein
MMPKKTVVYILPHFDDEVFVIPKIRMDLKEGSRIKFFFLMTSELRFKESQKFLSKMGVDKNDIISIGREFQIQDSLIHENLVVIYKKILSSLTTLSPIDDIICPAYEGGHQDHDSASILSRKLARVFKSKVIEFYLYNGYGTFGRFYKVASPINVKKIILIDYSFEDHSALFKVLTTYKSQFMTMLGLLPFLFFKSFLSPLTLNVLMENDLKIIEHTAVPLYQRWRRVNHDEFCKSIGNTIAKDEE